nr:hypothetical protein [uncultured Rhodoferax sp.]
MAVTAAEVLRGMYNTARTMGDKSINSDATFVIEGHSELALLTKQFPWPTLSPGGEVAVPGPIGTEAWQAQQLKLNQQGQISFMETVQGRIQQFLEEVISTGAKFDATVYEGTPDRFHRACKLRDCFFQSDNTDRDWENRSAITLMNGTLFFHYFGETIPGNIVA